MHTGDTNFSNLKLLEGFVYYCHIQTLSGYTGSCLSYSFDGILDLLVSNQGPVFQTSFITSIFPWSHHCCFTKLSYLMNIDCLNLKITRYMSTQKIKLISNTRYFDIDQYCKLSNIIVVGRHFYSMVYGIMRHQEWITDRYQIFTSSWNNLPGA